MLVVHGMDCARGGRGPVGIIRPSERETMETQNVRQGGFFAIRPQGLLSGEDATSLGRHLSELAADGKSDVVIDCSGLRFVDSRGLEVLVDAAEEFIRAGRALKLSGVKPAFREVLDLTDLAPLFEFQESKPQTAEASR
jgi:anti-anti-sigma factor